MHAEHMREKRGVYMDSVGKPEGKKPLGRPRHRWEDNIKMDLQNWDRGVWTGLIWLRIGTGGGLLRVWKWNFGFHKTQGIWLAGNLSASQEELSSMVLVSDMLVTVYACLVYIYIYYFLLFHFVDIRTQYQCLLTCLTSVMAST